MPGTSNYSRLSVASAVFLHAERVFDVGCVRTRVLEFCVARVSGTAGGGRTRPDRRPGKEQRLSLSLCVAVAMHGVGMWRHSAVHTLIAPLSRGCAVTAQTLQLLAAAQSGLDCDAAAATGARAELG